MIYLLLHTNKFCHVIFATNLKIYAFRISSDLERVQKAVRDSGSAKIIDGYMSVKDGAQKAFNQVSSILKMVRIFEQRHTL